MIDAEERKAIFLLHQKGIGMRKIALQLGISRNTVREILEHKGTMPDSVRSDKIRIETEILERLYAECNGYAQRVHEKLVEEEGIQVKYSTLTRMLREKGISRPQKTRCDEVPDRPGVEMQHDTTVYYVPIAQKRTRVTASLLYMRYSKRRHLKFYRAFNRFKMKCFFHEGLMFWGYSAAQCIIDNTNLARLRGTGKNAVIVPEMEVFGKRYGFEFICHEKGHANRKGRKNRICPVWPETAVALKRLVESAPPDGHVFRSVRGNTLSRDGAAYILQKHMRRATGKLPALRRRHVTPHTMRHSCAVGMLQAGIDLTVIRDYLGHESIATTGRYTKTNLEMKRRVLENFWRRSGLTRTRDPRWRPPSDLFALLSSL